MSGLTLSEKRAIAGRKGGLRTAKKYGKRYMKRLAKFGAHRMHSLYRRVPVMLNDFAIVHRKTGVPVALLSGRPVELLGPVTFAPDQDHWPYGPDEGCAVSEPGRGA